MFLGEDELHLLWGWVFEKGSYPACFSADFVLPIETFLLSLECQGGVPFTPQTGAVQRGPTASMSDAESCAASIVFLENGCGR